MEPGKAKPAPAFGAPSSDLVKPGDRLTFHIQEGVRRDVIIPLTVLVTDQKVKVGNHYHYKTVPFEDQIHPLRTPFAAPYREYANGDPSAFDFNWEKLHFAFDLPDPHTFPPLSELDEEDLTTLEIYVDTCRRLASYGAFSFISKINFFWDGEKMVIEGEFPQEDRMVGAATRFRQVYMDQTTVKFENAANRINKAVKKRGDQSLRELVSRWRAAFQTLEEQCIQAVIFKKLSCPEGCPNCEDSPVNFGIFQPKELIRTYYYGDLIHFEADQRAKLTELNKTPNLRVYYNYAYHASLSSLAHLSFGFSALVESAMGGARRIDLPRQPGYRYFS